MHLNHPETIPPQPQPQSVEKLSSMRLVPGAKKVGDRCFKTSTLVPYYRNAVIEVPAKSQDRASLVVQWLRIRLPMQGTRVRALVWEDPTCRGATGPVSHNY